LLTLEYKTKIHISMHRVFVSLLFILLFSKVFSQEISLSAGPLWGLPVYYQPDALGDTKGSMKTGFNLDMSVVFSPEKKTSHGMILGYRSNAFKEDVSMIGSQSGKYYRTIKMNLYYVGYKLNIRTSSDSYLTLSPLFAFKSKKIFYAEEQTGLGLSFSYAHKIKLTDRTFLKFEPALSILGIIPFVDADFPSAKLTSFGLNVGWGYIFNKHDLE